MDAVTHSILKLEAIAYRREMNSTNWITSSQKKDEMITSRED